MRRGDERWPATIVRLMGEKVEVIATQALYSMAKRHRRLA